ncbi:methyl-accepting chemotaxis protein [Granulosicoccaceae sp. 1_MG-2023]|nr:methyl-accepting chemotaxis protein [Granulosicoccaceae sp. 1_MG-2023]
MYGRTKTRYLGKRFRRGFTRAPMVLFVLLLVAMAAAVYCFVDANYKGARNAALSGTVAQLRILASRLALDARAPEGRDHVPDELAAGQSLLDGLGSGDRAAGIPRVPDMLAPELAAARKAWAELGSALLPGQAEAPAGLGKLDPAQLETIAGLGSSLGRWLTESNASEAAHSAFDRFVKLLDQVRSLSESALQGGPEPSVQTQLGDAWQELGGELERLRELTAEDADARVLVLEISNEMTRLTPAVSGPASAGQSVAPQLSDQFARHAELQLVLRKLDDAVALLRHEQALLFRLGVIAALVSLLFLFVLAIVFWRDAQNKLAASQQRNAANQRAILRLLDEITDLAEGDLTTRATVTEDITGAIADSVNYAIDTIRELVVTLDDTAEKVARTAQETSETATRLTRASALQEREVRRSSNYITAMASTMRQMSADALEAREVANQSELRAMSGYQAVSQTIEGMTGVRGQIQDTAKRLKRLGESSQQIGDIISLVNDIAERTNLLALNAAIQAGGGGGQNRYSAVADEVQRLAERVNEATRDIEGLIVTIQADTRAAISSMEDSTAGVVKGAKMAEEAGVELAEIQRVSVNLAKRIKVISEKSARQAEVTAKLSGNMQVISEIAQQTNDGMKTTADSIDELQEMSRALVQTVDGFQLPGDAHRSATDKPSPAPSESGAE